MNSLSTVTLYTLLVIGAVALMNVAAYQNQDTNSANTVGGDPGTTTSNCDRSEVYSRCNANPSCQKTCDNYEEPNACSSSGTAANECYPGCVCKSGFVRVVKGDRCIPIDKCEGRVRH
ncbi:venom serine protease inhibitor-like [Athalia rosae]|uniref:venom serine protease inhibitor-like n=1 Tax=Athalia rosae TaxID=37344 RepID=UPI00203348E4|nr:venom serine protease inhibitor-like [Athalia rosae]